MHFVFLFLVLYSIIVELILSFSKYFAVFFFGDDIPVGSTEKQLKLSGQSGT